MTATRSHGGFTLIELLIVISIATILLAIAVPNFTDFIRNSRLSSQANDLILTLMYAKSEAVKRGRSTVVCSSANGSSCAASTSWEQGWIAYQDADADGIVDAGEILQVRHQLEGNNTLRAARTSIIFQNTGFSSGSNDTFKLCDSRGNTSMRGVVLNSQGRVRMATDGTDADTIVEDDSGTNLTCP